jgi:hypothetical protein
MLEGPGKKPPPTFSQMYKTLKPGLLESGQHVRGGTEGGQRVYYTRDPLMPTSPFDGGAVERRLEAYKTGARFVRKALINEYGKSAAEDVLRSVTAKVPRDLKKEVTRGDLELIHQELQQPKYRVLQHSELQVQDQEVQRQEVRRQRRKLQPQDQELHMLRSRVTYDTPNAIKDDLAGDRASTIKKYYGPNGTAKFELLQSYMQRYRVQFDSEKGTLALALGGGQGDKENEADKLAALAGFIDRHFEVKPRDPAFRNIANNILLYLPPGAPASMARKMQRVANGRLSSYTADDTVRSTFTLSVSKDGNGNPRSVGVACDASAPYTRAADSPVDFSKYRFVRKESFEISGAQLGADPPAFDARANLIAVSRLDTIQLAD